MAPSYYRLLEGSTVFTEPSGEPQQVSIRFERYGDISKIDDIKVTFVEITARRGTAPIRDNRGPADIARGFPATYYQSGSEATGGDFHNYLLDSKTGLEREYTHIRLLPGQTTDGIAFYLLPDGAKDGTKEFQFRIEALEASDNTIQALYQTIKIIDAQEGTGQSAQSIFTIDPIVYVNEGQVATVTLRRSGNLNDSHYIRLGESWRSSQLPAKIGQDFSGDFVGRELTILPNQSEISFQVSTIDDTVYEDLRSIDWNGSGEWFDVIATISNGLRSNTPVKWENLPGYDSPEGQTRIFINDNDQPTPTYSLSPSSTSINEGSTLTSTVSTTNVASGTALYYSLSGTGINSSDFSSGSLTGSGTVSSSGSFSFSHTLANDLTTEGSETLQIRLFTDSSRSTQVASTSVSINDTSLTPPALPSYLLTPSTTTINEGSLVSTTINTTNVASGTTLYWTAVGSGITTSDFSFGALSGSASIGSDGKATFSHVLANDLSTEGSETLNILLYSDSNRSNQIAATSVNVNDTSISPATPTVAVGGNNTGVINTGSINNSGTINSGTINTNSGNTTNTTTNTSNVTVGPTIINNITNNITNTTTNTTSVLSNTSYPTYNVNNTWANNLVTGAITGSAPTLAKNSFDYKFYNLGGGRYGVQEKGSSKIDEITGASSLKFADQTLTPANDVAATFNQVKGKDDVSGVVFRLYNAAFSRLPDANGLQNWINGNASGGMTYASSAQSFSESQEFKNRYGSNVTDTQFITTLYNNVLGRAPDAGGLSHYQSLLAGGRSRGALLLDFSESPENRVLFTQVTGLE